MTTPANPTPPSGRFRRPRLWPRSFRAQLSLLLIATAIVGSVGYALYEARQQARFVIESIRGNGEVLVRNLAVDAAHQIVRQDFATLELLLRQYAALPGVLEVRVLDADARPVGWVVRPAEGKIEPRYAFVPDPDGLVSEPRSRVVADGRRLLLEAPARAGSITIGAVRLVQSLDPARAIRQRIYRNTFGSGALAAALAVLGMFLYLRRPLRAIREASDFARGLDDRLGASLRVERSASEFEALGDALNEASRRLREQERAVVVSATRLQAVLDNAVDGIFTVDGEEQIASFNPAAERIFGIAATDAIGRDAAQLFVGPLAAHPWTLSTSPVQGELSGRRADGGTFPVELSSGEVEIDGVTLHVAIVRDVTERVAYELALRESEERARKLAIVASRTSNAVIITDPQARIEWVNDGFTRITGYTLEEAIGRNPGRLLQGPESDPVVKANIREHIARGEGFKAEIVNYHKSGEPYWIEMDVQPVLDADGELMNFIAIQNDITERKQVAQELASQRDFAMTVMNTIGQGLTVVGADWRFEYVNPAYARMVGYAPEELVGRSPTVVADTASRERLQRVQSARLAGEVTSYEIKARHAAGHELDLLVTGVPRFDGGKFAGTISVITDISERKRQELELRAAKEVAEKANHAKSEFLSRMSHELRTPLNAILGFTQLLELDDMTADQHDSLRRIMNAGRHLLDLINEVLDLSRIESGRMVLSLEPVALCTVVDESLRLMKPLAHERDISIELDGHPSELWVSADLQRLMQVLINLLSNAIKYNRPRGSVQIGCSFPHEGRLRIEVRDHGPGIAPELLDRLFVPFDRLGAEDSAVEGSGIGLALTQRLVLAMQGQIGVDSTPGEGSVFWIELPRAATPAVPSGADVPAGVSAPTNPSGRRTTVAYLEDNLSNLMLVEKVLARADDLDLITAMEGRQGLDLIRRERPDLVLLDLHLPGLDGEEILAELKRDPGTAEIPVVVVSADAMPDRIERLLATGWLAGYLTKPIDVRELLMVVRGELDGAGGEVTEGVRADGV